MKLSFLNLKSSVVALCVLTALATSADAKWWNKDWTIRKQIEIDTTTAGTPIADEIGTVAILLRLHEGNFRFADAKDDGSDIRFIASDDKTALAYHVEKYDGLLNEAFVWVQVPDLKPGTKARLWLYYGNAKAPRADDPKGTYDVNTSLVYHFAENNGPPQDSTTYGNNADKPGIRVSGSLIGPGTRWDASTTIGVSGSESLNWADGSALTWSAWIKPAGDQGNETIFSRGEGTNNFVVGLDNGSVFLEVKGQRSQGGPKLEPNSWHHVAVVATGSAASLSVDGQSVATINATLPPLSTPLVLGANSTTGSAGFAGEMDELVISKVARPVGAIKVAVLTQGDKASKLLTLAPDEIKSSWFSAGYVGVILSSLTVDGWIVIGVLVIMSAISWMVMVTKARYLSATAKGNAVFLRDWKHVAADLSFLDERDTRKVVTLGGRIDARERQLVRHSSVYHIYKIGAEEIRHRLAMERAHQHVLSARSIQAIRATLDAGLVRETQKLNRLMVLLTIAISGGPFLGLLGTVVGVMITFAAIAAQGDVNVNAIAPGIAAALAATVAGLVVAIPALFGYNYLVSRLKDVVSDMQVFIDEFVTKVAEYYGDVVPPNKSSSRREVDSPLELIA
jgi:biopolymer transport protein ExbB